MTDFCETNSLEEKRNVLFWVITQQVVVILYWHFRTNYRSHPRGSRIFGNNGRAEEK